MYIYATYITISDLTINTLSYYKILLYNRDVLHTTLTILYSQRRTFTFDYTTLRDCTILYHAITLYFYIILLFYSLRHIHTIAYYVILICYIHIYSIIENCYIEKSLIFKTL